VIRMVVLSVSSEAYGPSITRRRHLSRRPYIGRRVINRTRHYRIQAVRVGRRDALIWKPEAPFITTVKHWNKSRLALFG
jgi:hypothetical protein